MTTTTDPSTSSMAQLPRPAASVLFAAAPLLLFVGERLVGDGTSRVVVTGCAAAALVVGIALRLVEQRGASVDVRAAAALGLVPAALALVGGLAYGARVLLVEDPKATPVLAGALVVATVIAALLTLLAVVSFEVALAPMRDAGAVELPRVRAALGASLGMGLVLAGLALGNYAASTLDVRRDLASNAPTAPSDATISLIEAAPRPVEVKLFFEQGSPALAELQDYFDAMRERGVSVEVLDHAYDPELANTLKVSKNGTVAVRSGERSETWFVGTERDQAQRKLKKLDEEVRTRVAKVSRDAVRIVFTAGHGERDVKSARPGARPAASGLKKLIEQLNAKVETIGVGDGLATAVPDDVAVVVIAGPTKPFLAEEVAALVAYAERGGSLLVMVDPRLDTGLGPLLDALGVAVGTGSLANDADHIPRTRTDADRVFLYSSSFTSHKAVRNLSQLRGEIVLLFFDAAPVTSTKKDGLRTTALVRSRPKTFEDLDGDRTFDEGTEKRAVVDFATAVERDAGKKSEGEEPTNAGLRAVVVGDSDVLSDALFAHDVNQVFALDTVLWLLKDDVAGGAITSDDVPIRHTKDGDVWFFYGTVLAGPVAVLAVGLAYVSRRRRRRT